MPRKNRIFLAHASEDEQKVNKLYDALKERGYDPWLDKVDLIPGQVWRVEIPKAITEAAVFLACLSKSSVEKKGYVQREYGLALSAYGERPAGSIFLIPVRLDDCEVPPIADPQSGLSLKDLHWVDLWKEGGLDRLADAIEHSLNKNALPKADSPKEKVEEKTQDAPPLLEKESKTSHEHEEVQPRASRSPRWRLAISVIPVLLVAGLFTPFLQPGSTDIDNQGDNRTGDDLSEDDAESKQPEKEASPLVPPDPCQRRFEKPLTDTEAKQVFECLEDSLKEEFAGSGEPVAQEFHTWWRYSEPYESESHGDRYVVHWGNREGASYINYEDAGTLPKGSAFAMSSYAFDESGQPEIGPIFIMEKMDLGFDAASGNWRFAMIEPDSTGDNASSKALKDCKKCHIKIAKSQDYLYFPQDRYRVSN